MVWAMILPTHIRISVHAAQAHQAGREQQIFADLAASRLAQALGPYTSGGMAEQRMTMLIRA
jgi:hypothetical protein